MKQPPQGFPAGCQLISFWSRTQHFSSKSLVEEQFFCMFGLINKPSRRQFPAPAKPIIESAYMLPNKWFSERF